jgi:hypothetical protein
MKIMKITKIFTSLLLFLSLTTLVLFVNNSLVFASHSSNHLKEGLIADLYDPLLEIQETTKLPTFEQQQHGKASIEPGASNITSAIYFVIDFMKYFIGAIAVVMIIVTGIRLILARKKIDEVWPKQKEHLIMIAVGIVFIFIADVAVKKVFFGEVGEIYETEQTVQLAAEEGTLQLKGMYNVGMMLAGAIAVFMLVIAGFRLLTSAGNEEVQTKVKKQITWIVLGLLLIGIAEFVVQDFIFPEQGSKIPSAEKGKYLLVSFTNFISAFIAIAAVISGIYGGYLYVTAVGNEEKTGKAKKILLGVIIALVIALAAYALVNTVIQLEPRNP